MLGQRQLNQDAVDARLIVEAVDQRHQFVLAGGGRQVIGLGNKADFLAVLALVRDIDLGGRVATNQNHSQTRCAQALLASFGDALRDLLAEAGGNRFAVDQFCGHCAWLTIKKGWKKDAHSRMTVRWGKGACRGFRVTPLYS